MDERTAAIVGRLRQRFPDIDFATAALIVRKGVPGDQWYVRLPADPRLVEVMRFLHDDAELEFDQLCELTCVDYLNFPDAADRYGVTYGLLSTTRGHRLWAKCFVNDPAPTVPSVVGVWNGAVWMEREVWDMFGVRFEGHPDLRRILTWEGFEAHPLRKDYPLRGRGERENYPTVVRHAPDVSVEDAHFPMRPDDEP